MNEQRDWSRRRFVRTGARGFLGIAALNLLAACGGQPPATTPGASAPGTTAVSPATAAPGAPASGAPGSPSQVTRPATTTAAASGDPAIGKALIGQLEGPEVLTDPAQFPKSFAEAPQLADQVKAGKLPAVAERVGQDPLVIKPVREIGRYGGTWRGGFTGPNDKFNGWRVASGTDNILYWDYTGDKVVPNIARSWEAGDGGRTLTLQLRRGMRWSDGEPFTADDFVFWFEDMCGNKELNSSFPSVMTINGKPGALEKVDTYSVRFRFPDPYFLLPDVLAGTTALGGQANQGLNAQGGYAPAHYLKQFHPKYAAKEDLDRRLQEAKLDKWPALFKLRNDWALNPDLPVVSPWKTVTPINTPTWTLERNPYSIWVDTQGNQLPYIDKIVLTLAESLEVINLRAIAGEYDHQARHLDISKLPVFIQNQAKGGYKMALDTGDYGSDMVLQVNLSYAKDAEIAKWFNTTDFRRALSLGIDRDQLNETFWLGTGTPGSTVPRETNKYSPGPQYRTLWATRDQKAAAELLDKIGLGKKDGDGFRLRTDNGNRLTLELQTLAGQFFQFTQAAEMVRAHWKQIGIDLAVKEVEPGLGNTNIANNETQLAAWNNDGSDHLFTFPDRVFPYNSSSATGVLYAQWFQSGGTQGKEPPPRVREVMDKFRRAFGVPEAERILLGKEIWQIVADECWVIGTVGLAAASMGVRLAKTNLGNVPARQYNSPDVKNTSISRPVTFFYRQ